MLKRRKFVQISGLSMCIAALPTAGGATTNLLQKGTLELHLTSSERRFLRAAQAEIISGMDTEFSPKEVAKLMLYPVDVPVRNENGLLSYRNAAGQLVKISKKKGEYVLAFTQ